MSEASVKLVNNYEEKESVGLRYHSFFMALSQVCGFFSLFLTAYWLGNFNGGFKDGLGPTKMGKYPNGTEYPVNKRPSNGRYHGIFMMAGMVFLQGEAILVYRAYRHESKIFSKLIHAALHLGAFILVVLGLYAVVNFKNNFNQKQFYTAHSWVGIGVVSGFMLQYVFGFVNFLFPKTAPSVRAWFLPVHRTMGLVIFGISCAEVLMGIMQESWILIMGSPYFGACYGGLDCHGQAWVLNFAVISIILYAVSVVFITVNESFRRKKTPDELV